MDDLAKNVVTNLFLTAWRKFQILNINPTHTAQIQHESENYSIQDILEQKIHHLESTLASLWSYKARSSSGSSEEMSRVSSACSNLNFFYDKDRFLISREEVRTLTLRLGKLERLYDLKNYELANDYCWGISKNIFVYRWEQARLEQLTQEIANRHEELRKSTATSEAEIRNALEASGLVHKFYTSKRINVLQDCEQWMERFEREVQELESRFQIARTTKKQWEQMKATFESREEEIERLELLEVEYPERIKIMQESLKNALTIKLKRKRKKGDKRRTKKKSGKKRKVLGKLRK